MWLGSQSADLSSCFAGNQSKVSGLPALVFPDDHPRQRLGQGSECPVDFLGGDSVPSLWESLCCAEDWEMVKSGCLPPGSPPAYGETGGS